MIYDISYRLHPEIQVYKNLPHKKPTFHTTLNHAEHSVHETDITINLHTGTHVDYPLHMIPNGATSSTEQLEPLIGSCKVLDCTSIANGIEKEHLQQYDIKPNDFLLLKTKNSFSEEFLFDFTYLSESGAKYLVEQNIRGVGTDGLGIERAQEGHPTHKQLLSNGIVIIEGLRLAKIVPGSYQLFCLPLSIEGVEASLARVVLLDNK